MHHQRAHLGLMLIAWLALTPAPADAQSAGWGVKAGVNRTSVGSVADYYNWILCCLPSAPDATVESSSRGGFTAGGFFEVPITGPLGFQGELLFARRRHAVDLQPFEEIRITFTRDHLEAAALLKGTASLTSEHALYLAGGPVFGWRVGESADSSDPALRRGDPATNVYVVQALAYSAPELLRTFQTSVAGVAGWQYRRVLLELRYTHGLQSIFKDRDGIVAGFVEAGGHEPTLTRLVGEFGPFLESAKSRDVTVALGFRF